MKDWLKIDKVSIFKGKDENGNRYLTQFLIDYKKIFQPKEINAGCERCLEEYYQKIINHLQMGKTENTSGFVLKAKYNGIPLEFGSPVLVTNANITKEYGEKLLKNHQRGKELFDKIPEDFETPKTDLSKLKREELDTIATDLGIEPKDFANKGEIITAIKEKQKEVNNIETQTE